MNLKRFALTSSLTAGLLFSTVPYTSAWATTTVQVSNTGSTFTVQGFFQKSGVPLSGAPAFLTVTDANNNIVLVDQVSTHKDGAYQFDWTMPPQTPSGTYTAKVSIDGDVQTAPFTYTALSTDGGWPRPVDDGPIRFTGELNGGSSQAVIYNTDTGLSESISGDSDTVTLDTYKSLGVITSAPANTSYLTISVPSRTTSDTTITVPGTLIAQMTNSTNSFGPHAHLLVATQQGSYDLPLDALQPELLNNVEDNSDGALVFQIGQTTPNTWDLDQVSSLQARDLTPSSAIRFDLTATYGGQNIPIEDFGNSYVRYSIDLSTTQLNPSATQSALLVNAKTNDVVPAPSTLYHDAVGHAKMVITRTGNGMYIPIEANRTFNDVPASALQAPIDTLASHGIINGTAPATFAPYGPITRAQFATLMVRALGVSDKQGSSPFGDVTANDWFHDYVGIGSSLGLISGYSSYQFGPNDPITREQVASLLARCLQFVQTKPYVDTARVLSPITDEASISSWAREDVALAVQTGIVDPGTTTFAPKRNATRAEAAEMLYNLLKYLKFV